MLVGGHAVPTSMLRALHRTVGNWRFRHAVVAATRHGRAGLDAGAAPEGNAATSGPGQGRDHAGPHARVGTAREQAMLGAVPAGRMAADRCVDPPVSTAGPGVWREASTEDCDPDQEQTVLTSHFRASRFLARAIAVTEVALRDVAEPVAAALKTWFSIDREDASRAFENGRDYGKLQRALRTMQGPAESASYECGSFMCRIAEPRAISSLGDIVLCDAWFADADDDSRAATLVHEWAHKWGDGVARAIETYEHERDWSGMSSSRRVTMPDAYEGFAKQVSRL